MAYAQWFCVEQDPLLRQLKPVETVHHRGRCCMEGTRQSILKQIMAWVTNSKEGAHPPDGNTYWLYGSLLRL